MRVISEEVFKVSIYKMNLKITLKIIATSLRGQWVNDNYIDNMRNKKPFHKCLVKFYMYQMSELTRGLKC